jgi:hypothetical protein
MQKVYLLLRNNNQTGPFNVEELLQHELKSTDLVWEEGKSGGWSYPYEIASLKPFIHLDTPAKEKPAASKKSAVKPEKAQNPGILPLDTDAPFASRTVTSKNVYVSLPGNGLHYEEPNKEILEEESLEQKAEAIRRRALAAADHKKAATNIHSLVAENPLEVNYELETKVARTTEEIGEDYSAWLYTRQVEKKRKARRRKSLIAALASICVIVAGFVLVKERMAAAGNDTVIKESISKEQIHQETKSLQENVQPEMVRNTNVVVPPADSVHAIVTTENLAPVPLKSTPAKKEVIKQERVSNQHQPESAKTVGVMASKKTPPTENIPAENKNNQPNKVGQPASSGVASVPNQKETLENKVSNFFGKILNKDKGDKPAQSEIKTEGATAERETKRRTEEPAPVISIANQVNVTANASSGNWMMGVRGLKLTLQNKSNETLKTAIVEVRYYNEQKELIEKKQVQFSNILPKKSQTVMAPDHRLADHADYQLISAIAKEDAYVKQ